ncbi:unnamed protein product [Rotaria socialis]|uniref:Endonuclease/exonuclease/phosphatase domain-containing protein n=1 Tax=Rotaria socialis TaxID=392032 RepID=A0A818XAZ8_9BILA|nr:unnamed protein product [Rotaria socialis]CAF3346067.1 unnamed protein product [Rotaria socialis]CAF3736682.1 unnamed protein product [Rotaria socialis]CAF4211454.1 unnamed protein product [Rotaria socialis]CAF4418259.1 unnamed protein product [Rotaria socialis]
MPIRIVSYNLLAPIFGDRPEMYRKCQPQFLKTDHRWNLIQSQLKQEINHHDNTIICLQEICLEFLPKLDLFFHELNYSFFQNLYGPPCTDYLGVGIAIPISMQLQSISYIRIGDYMRSMSKPRETKNGLFAWGQQWWQFLMNKFAEPAKDTWDLAMSQTNTLICLQVVIDHKIVYVANYHMPSLYLIPDLMQMHASVVKDCMFELAAGQNFILSGDFNLKPYDVTYRILTEKGYDQNLPESYMYEISYRPNSERALKSAYLEKNGAEPVYTNFRDVAKSPNFCETLDYIFFQGNLIVEKVLELPDQPLSESYPDETHPSDHLLIAASFRLL